MAPRSTNRSRARKNPKNRSLNALAIASSQVSEKPAVAAHRLGKALAGAGKKRAKRDEEDKGKDEDEDEESNRRSRDDGSVDGGSDSDGGKWKVGVDSDDESDIDSDEAMGESDDERFADFVFRGSSSKGRTKKKGKAKEMDLDESEGDDGDDESEEDGEGFIDLSEVFDRADTPSDDDQKTRRKKTEPGSKKRAAPADSESDDDGSTTSSGNDNDNDNESDSDSFTNFSEEDTTPEDPTKLAALHALIASLPSSTKPAAKRVRLDDPNEGKTPNEYNLSLTSNSQKLTVNDLLPSISDSRLKRSLKVLADPSPANTKQSGVQGKLSAPLAKRQQDRLDRTEAYKKTTETLGRWVDTVKANREAEHLHFPLANAPNAPIKALARLSSMSASNSTPLTALEETISGILKDSNMQDEEQLAEFESLKTNKLSVEEVQKRVAELRLTRELLYREELKAKRIKKIKSKAYHRVHKKERLRQEEAIKEALVLERGGVSDGEETMERERKRAEERMTLRHKQSKWAKGMKESGRTVWDEEAADGAVDMARRAEELTKRIRGKDVKGEESEFEGSNSSEEEDEFDEEGVVMKERLLRDIEKMGAPVGVVEGGSKRLGGRLMEMKFMQNAEAARKKENDAALEEFRKSLEDGNEMSDNESNSEQPSGRMTFRPTKESSTHITNPKTDRSEFEEREERSGSEQGIEDEKDEEVTFVGEASATTIKNPFSQPKITSSQSDGINLSFGQRKEGTTGPSGNPWIARDNSSLVQSKKQTLLLGKQERKGERTNLKLAKDRKSALQSPADNGDVEIDTTMTLKVVNRVANPDDDGDEVDDREINLIPTGSKGVVSSQRELVKRAFAGDNVVANFEKEKKRIVEDEDDKVIDETLPGWGRWTGEGLDESMWPQKKFFRTVKGISKDKRKDAKMAKVIINEKRVKKVLHNYYSFLSRLFCAKDAIRMLSTTPRASHIRLRLGSSMNGVCEFRLGRSGLQRRLSRTRQCQGLWLSRVLSWRLFQHRSSSRVYRNILISLWCCIWELRAVRERCLLVVGYGWRRALGPDGIHGLGLWWLVICGGL